VEVTEGSSVAASAIAAADAGAAFEIGNEAEEEILADMFGKRSNFAVPRFCTPKDAATGAGVLNAVNINDPADTTTTDNNLPRNWFFISNTP
jgi:hypothetical protein